ncbi:MAG: hypothetical protein M0R22_07945 [Dehalococcoidia bacterium]|jgi:hypothetical protein|nr:hypothetical protein [Dehalococcoidia bacterium]
MSARWRTDEDEWDRLSSDELRVLAEYRQPLERWGYAGKEVGTPEGNIRGLSIYHLVTDISDVVFRTISNLSGSGRVPRTDTITKLQSAQINLGNLLDQDRLGDCTTRGLRRDIVQFLDPFVRGRGGVALEQLADQPLEDYAHSPPYIAIVTAANALVYMAYGDFREAREIIDSYIAEYDENYPDSDDD